MPLAEIESVVFVSSEDSLNPAKNLLTSAIGGNVKKWLCQKKGEKNVYVIFKLKEKANITNIIVGNENTAIIEILVGNSDSQEKEYQVLLPTSELQSVQDVRTGRSKSAVRFFTTKDFNTDVAGRQWERIKVVCSQPYDSHIRYGLSCFVVKSFKDEDDYNEARKGADEIQNGERNKTVELPEDEKRKVNEWKEDVLQRLAPGSSSSSLKRKEQQQNSISPLKRRTNDQNLADVAGTSSENISGDFRNESKNCDERDSKLPITKENKNPLPPALSPKKKDFSRLFYGVRFSMSGFENPLRSDLRNKALEMGARYAADWDSRCTHLICAFPNTPKYNAVKQMGNGKIVTKDWIEVCHSKRRRLPWRRFALDSKEKQLPESEEDDEEEIGKSQNPRKKYVDRRRRLPSSSSSSSDTEDEIEKIQTRRKVMKLDNKTSNKDEKIKDKEELYNADTDKSDHGASEDDVIGQRPDTSDLPLPHLPDFPTHNYFIAKDEKGEYRHQLERYIHAFKGNQKNIKAVPAISHVFGKHCFCIGCDISDGKRKKLKNFIDSFQWKICEEISEEVEFVISDDTEVAKQILLEHPKIRVIKSDWIWKCNDEDYFISPNQFLLK